MAAAPGAGHGLAAMETLSLLPDLSGQEFTAAGLGLRRLS